jgi:2-oxoglutarate dehydrogenase E2 component (dihydrolipoamide succinyltransferase)
MAIEIRVPTLGESISEATVGKWFKKAGETVRADEPLVELETDKVTLEVNAPGAGVLSEITAETGQTVAIGALLGQLSGGATAPAAAPAPAAAAKAAPPTAMPPAPSAAKIAAEDRIDLSSVAGSGKRGQVLKGDVLAAAAAANGSPPVVAPAPAPAPVPAPALAPLPVARPTTPDDSAREERVRMTKLRQTIARRLKDAQNTAAMLTTFNEVDMSEVMALRARYKDAFEKKHGAKLGFMGFFVKACVQALKEIPPSTPRSTAPTSSTRTITTSASPSAPTRGSSCRWCATPTSFPSPRSRRRSPISENARATVSSSSRNCRAARSPSPTAASTAR